MDQDKEKLWKKRVQDYQSSGLSGSEWCKRHGIPVNRLWYWKKKLVKGDVPKEEETRQTWVPVTVDASNPGEIDTGMTIRVGAVEIEVKPGFNAVLLQEVVRTLRALC